MRSRPVQLHRHPAVGLLWEARPSCHATLFIEPAIWTPHKGKCPAFSIGTVLPTYPASVTSTSATAKPTSVLSPSIRCSGELA